MSNRWLAAILTAAVAFIMSGCSTSKSVPEGMYLLDKVNIKSDNKQLDAAKLEPYIRQRAGSKSFSLFKLPFANSASSNKDSVISAADTTNAAGKTSVVFDSIQAHLTCNDIEAITRDMGYLGATADYELSVSGNKKASVTYNLHTGPMYFIGKIHRDIEDEDIKHLLEHCGYDTTCIKEGMPFMVKYLDDERKRITTLLNDNGYFSFNKDFITFSADSVKGRTAVDITLKLHKYRRGGDTESAPHRRYTVRNITYYNNNKGVKVPIRQSVLEENTLIKANGPFNASDLKKTYNKFGRLPIVKYTNIKFNELPGSDTLTCDIGISTNKTNTISFQPEGTNTAGNLGAAASLTYENRNIFKGAETFSIKLHGAFEAITGLEGYQNEDYEEYNLETKIVFPRFLIPFLSKKFRQQSTALSELSASYNMQNRPEFHRRVFTAAWRYRWSGASLKRNFKIDLVDLNYIYMPWISTTFKEEYLDNADSRNSILRYNYEDLFIMKAGFGMSYNNGNEAYKFNIETAGNILNGMSRLLSTRKNSENQYTLFNIAFAQYVKADFDYTRLLHINRNNDLALHFGLGISYPYGNSTILPFEKRYFSGGANSVRGWSVRELGPGRFKGTDGSIDFINRTGDIKLDINMELRSFLFWKIYGAAFIDAGNIWTLRYYDEQPGGRFDITDFYEQIAVAYGLGIRLNFDFFILRFDMGMKAVNPAYSSSNEHYAVFHPDFNRDFAFHFAVGLPF